MHHRLLFPILLLASLSAPAADFTVGPDGTYATVQGGINAALAAAGDNRVLVQAGTYVENLTVNLGASGDRLELSGGWNATFTARSPRTSILDGNATNRVIDAVVDAGDELVVDGFEITNGSGDPGGGISLYLEVDGIGKLSDNLVTSNLAESARATGGGLAATLSGGSRLEIIDSTISDNIARSLDTVDVRAGGLSVQTNDTAELLIRNNLIANNSALIDAPGSSLGGGADLALFSSETAQFIDNTVSGNVATGNGQSGVGLNVGGVAWLVERNSFTQNPPAGAATFARQVILAVWGSSGIARSNLVADAPGKGFFVSASGSASAHVSNLTAVNIEEADVQAAVNGSSGAQVTIYNSLTTDEPFEMLISPDVQLGSNLFGGELGLVDLAAGNYRLSESSPGRDAGDNAAPGGVGSLDLDDRTRILDGTVDIGAYEYAGPIFADRFELAH